MSEKIFFCVTDLTNTTLYLTYNLIQFMQFLNNYILVAGFVFKLSLNSKQLIIIFFLKVVWLIKEKNIQFQMPFCHTVWMSVDVSQTPAVESNFLPFICMKSYVNANPGLGYSSCVLLNHRWYKRWKLLLNPEAKTCV